MARTLAIVAAVALSSVASPALAAYPDRPIKLIVPFTAGGATDIAGRVLAEELGKALGGNAVVENREGAAGVIGVQAAMRAPADGYTFVITGNSLMTSHKTLYKNLPYDPLKDFETVARVSAGSHIIVVKPDSPYKDVKGLLAAARAKPGSITYGSGGSGTSVHLAAEMFQVMSGTNSRMKNTSSAGSAPLIIKNRQPEFARSRATTVVGIPRPSISASTAPMID